METCCFQLTSEVCFETAKGPNDTVSFNTVSTSFRRMVGYGRSQIGFRKASTIDIDASVEVPMTKHA